MTIDEEALTMARSIAREYNVEDSKIISLIQLGAIAGIKNHEKCTCLSELALDAYGPGGPMSGKPLPPPCRLHP